jgi:hypothetical protein
LVINGAARTKRISGYMEIFTFAEIAVNKFMMLSCKNHYKSETPETIAVLPSILFEDIDINRQSQFF